MIVERTQYYAKSGIVEKVLAVRREASRVRVAMDLDAGAIHINDGGEGPDVAWSCAFADEAAHQNDLDRRGASPEFIVVPGHPCGQG